MARPAPVVFFDLAETLGLEMRTPGGAPLAHFQPYAGVSRLLGRLRPHARLGVLARGEGLTSARVARALGATMGAFEPDLVVANETDSPTHFALAADRAGHGGDPSQCILVSPCRSRRLSAATVGFRAAPHPVLAEPLVHGRRLAYVRIVGAEPAGLAGAVAGLPVVGMHVDRVSATIYAAVDRAVVDVLLPTGVVVDVLLEGDAVGDHDLYLLRTDHLLPAAAGAFRTRLESQLRVVIPARNGLVVAVPGGRSVDEFHPPAAPHGHTVEFMPTVTYLSTAQARATFVRPALGERTALTAGEVSAFAGLTPAVLRKHHEPWCGLAPDPTGTTIQSRSIGHRHNRLAVEGIATVLAGLCGNARQPTLIADGRPTALANVEADLVGTAAPAEIVVVAAHLDSTAGNDPDYVGQESVFPAPGANDDGSGIAAVLAAAEILSGLAARTPPRRTIRFMLFNAEEYGLKGSLSSAADLRGREDQGELRVVAMLQMDMIGWTRAAQAPRPFELHASGADYSHLEAASTRLANLVATAAGLVSPGLAPQRYPMAGCAYDPVAFRSDHNSFLAAGWPAVAVTEDEFAEGCSTTAIGDPDYHLASDRAVNAEYASDIARAVAAAAWMLAADPAAAGPENRPSEGRPSENRPDDVRPDDVRPIPPGTTPQEKGTAMPTKFIHEFIRDFVSDKPLRCKVLKAEVTAMRDYGLVGPQITVLRTLDGQQILAAMLAELRNAYGLDLDTLRQEIGSLPPVPFAGGRTFATAAEAAAPAAASLAAAASQAAMLYSEGQIHIRRVEPLQVPLNQQMDVTVRGQGFDAQPEIRFRHEETSNIVGSTFGSSSCDVDVYQRIIVSVTLDQAGHWTALARNTAADPWAEAPATQRILVV